MNDPLLFWSSLALGGALLGALIIGPPNTFLFDLVRMLRSHGYPFARR